MQYLLSTKYIFIAELWHLGQPGGQYLTPYFNFEYLPKNLLNADTNVSSLGLLVRYQIDCQVTLGGV